LRSQAPMPLSMPAVFSIPISFLALVVVSLLTQPETVEVVEPAMGEPA